MFIIGFSKTAASVGKPHFRNIPIAELDPTKPDEVWTAKIDGAFTEIEAQKNKIPRLFSHRISKRTGKKIEYTDKLQHVKKPVKFTGRLSGETFAIDRSGNAVEPEIVSAMLNRGIERSKDLQKELGLKTQTALIDIPNSKAPFLEKRKFMEYVVKTHPSLFTLPEMASTQEEKRSLLRRITSGNHPQTKEGVIVHPIGEGISGKAKIFQEHDVYVRGVFPEEGSRGRMAGGFEYSWTPGGEIKGNIGTGFTHAEKKEMLEHPNRYIGRVARAQSQAVSKNKVLVRPSFTHWHVEKNLEKRASVLSKHATVFAKQSIIIDKEHEPDREKAKEIARQFADKIYTSRGTKTQWRFRQRPPRLFERGSFRHAKIKPGVSIIYGKIDEKRTKK